MYKILALSIISGFIGAFLHHAFRYGLREAWEDLKFCVLSITSDILEKIFNLFHHQKRCYFCKSIATKSARLYVGTKPVEAEGFVKWDYVDISFGRQIFTCNKHFIELSTEEIEND